MNFPSVHKKCSKLSFTDLNNHSYQITQLQMHNVVCILCIRDGKWRTAGRSIIHIIIQYFIVLNKFSVIYLHKKKAALRPVKKIVVVLRKKRLPIPALY